MQRISNHEVLISLQIFVGRQLSITVPNVMQFLAFYGYNFPFFPLYWQNCLLSIVLCACELEQFSYDCKGFFG
jgi:hypothetical protein